MPFESYDSLFSVVLPLEEGRLRFGLAIQNRFSAINRSTAIRLALMLLIAESLVIDSRPEILELCGSRFYATKMFTLVFPVARSWAAKCGAALQALS